ncbi:MAG: Crp/Fnr family transcriptional regulator [Notoacmeibacter sp.]|nr:Crp/Fnr family transcriptional regulator [Notoacmeibacter sp.]
MNIKTLDNYKIQNEVLRALRPEAQEFIQARVLTRPIHAGDVIFEDGVPFTHAVFPHEGVLSLMAQEEHGRTVEKASIGREGFLGFAFLLGGGSAISRSIVQVPGYASWLAIRDLDEALEQYECVRQAMLLYAKSLISQLMESVACNTLHSAEQRVTRWLLHAHDRVDGDVVMVTQQAIANALGMRRATINEACSNLQQAGTISYSRGIVNFIDRPALEERVCQCYGRIRFRFKWQEVGTGHSEAATDR